MKIRLENENDYYNVENLVRESFFNVYRPGCVEHFLLHKLRNDNNFIKDLSYILEIDDKIVGQVAFIKNNIKLKNNNDLSILTLGPICILPTYQKQGYGKLLLDFALNKVKEKNYGAVFLEGNINFYKKSGFTFASNYHIKYHTLSDNDDSSFFLCKELKKDYLKNINGEYFVPEIYFVKEKDVEEFDKLFKYKEKKILPHQIF